MLCPEGLPLENEGQVKQKEDLLKCELPKSPEGDNLECDFQSHQGRKKWKKTFTNFFKHDGASKSCEAEDESDSRHLKFREADFDPMQKWQSLGKIFRRQSLAAERGQSLGAEFRQQHGESSGAAKHKRQSIRSLVSGYLHRAMGNSSPLSRRKKSAERMNNASAPRDESEDRSDVRD